MKRILSITLCLLIICSSAFFSTSAASYTPVSTAEQLKDACITQSGGRYILTADIPISSTVMVNLNFMRSIYIDGNGHTIYAETDAALFDFSNSRACNPHFNNIKFDGKSRAQSAISTPDNKEITVYCDDCELTGFVGAQHKGAVILGNQASGYFTNCSFTGNTTSSFLTEKGADVAGADVYAEGIVDFSGCELGASVCAGPGCEVTCEDSVFNSLFIDETASLSAQRSTAEDLRTFSGNSDNIEYDSFLLTRNDKGITGHYTLKDEPVITNTVEDANDFELPFDSYSASQLLGVQLKRNISESVGSSSQETGRDLRFVVVANEGLIKGRNISDYGFVVAKLDASPEDVYASNKIAGMLTVGNAKTISCQDTVNSLSGDYGIPESSTPYKYVTMSVNGIDDNSTVIVRFYIKTTNGRIIYPSYIKPNSSLPLLASNYSAITGEYVS